MPERPVGETREEPMLANITRVGHIRNELGPFVNALYEEAGSVEDVEQLMWDCASRILESGALVPAAEVERLRSVLASAHDLLGAISSDPRVQEARAEIRAALGGQSVSETPEATT